MILMSGRREENGVFIAAVLKLSKLPSLIIVSKVRFISWFCNPSLYIRFIPDQSSHSSWVVGNPFFLTPGVL